MTGLVLMNLVVSSEIASILACDKSKTTDENHPLYLWLPSPPFGNGSYHSSTTDNKATDE